MAEEQSQQLISVDLDSRIARLQADQENLQAEHQKLTARLKEIEASYIATSGALEMLNQMKKDPRNEGTNGQAS